MKLIPLRRIDLAIGKPLPWAIYDKNQNLLMRAGEVIEARQQFESLIKRGLFRLPKSAAASAQGVAMPKSNSSGEAGAGHETYDFEDMKLPVGSRLQLQISTDQNPERHIAKYLGHIKGVSLLVATPVVDDKVLFIREGQTFIVRAFTGKTAFGFTASVIRACNAPTPYLHLSYPKQLHGVEIRSTKRLAVNIIATAQALETADTAKMPCLLINVSPSGALIAADQPLGEIGDAILVAFRVKLGPIDGYVETKGIIRSITHTENSSGEPQQNIHHGVQFNDLQQQDILLLHSLAYQKLVDGSTEL